MPQTMTSGIAVEPETERAKDRYYIYARGHLYGYEESAAAAVARASKLGGTAAAPDGRILWSRADWPAKNGINTMAVRYDLIGGSSLATCAAMVLAWEKENFSEEDLAGAADPVKALSDTMEGRVYDLSGRELSEMFYYVGRGIPVICRKNETDFVLLYGYDGEYVKFADPALGKTQIITQKRAESLFKEAGNAYTVYLR